MPTEPNYGLHFIPGAYALAIVPHGYYLVSLMLASKGQWSNVAPRHNWESIKSKVPIELYQRCIRARGAHINAFEGFPLFTAAMLAGTFMKLPAEDMNRVGLQYIGARCVYTALYIATRGEVLSYVRTGVWAWSIALPVFTIMKCAKVLNAD